MPRFASLRVPATMKLNVLHISQRFAMLVGMLGAVPYGHAAAISISVVDRKDRPVPHVVVYAEPKGYVRDPKAPRPQAIMNQANGRFVPHILVAETGSDIDFPNDDTVSHHVYSFSDANRFELPLYKGTRYPPIRFDNTGLVVLGCNIHDNMLGYILIVDTPFFALTDNDGFVRIDALPAGQYTIRVWTPRASADELPARIVAALDGDHDAQLDFRFTARLSPPHESALSSLSWSYY